MKTNDFVKDLQNQSVEELNAKLVEAKNALLEMNEYDIASLIQELPEENIIKAREFSNNCKYNRLEEVEGAEIGIITSGISYQYVKEVFGNTASVSASAATGNSDNVSNDNSDNSDSDYDDSEYEHGFVFFKKSGNG